MNLFAAKLLEPLMMVLAMMGIGIDLSELLSHITINRVVNERHHKPLDRQRAEH